MVDLIQESFNKADYYRNPVMVLADGMIGQMMEPIEFKEAEKMDLPPKDWATTGTQGKREHNVVNSLFLKPDELEVHNIHLTKKYAVMKEAEQRYEAYRLEGAEIVCVAYGTTSRIVKNAIDILAEEGIKVGLLRPISLWPFPEKGFALIEDSTKALLSVEMSMGQMIDDVKLAIKHRLPVEFFGRSGGMIPSPEGVAQKIREMVGGVK